MKIAPAIVLFLLTASVQGLFAQGVASKTDDFAYDGNKLSITFLGHASLVLGKQLEEPGRQQGADVLGDVTQHVFHRAGGPGAA